MPPLYNQDKGESPRQIGEDDLPSLRATRDAALQAAREAIRDTTRLTRLISILNDSGPLNLLLDRVLSTLSELFLADIVILLDPIGTGSYSPLAAIGLPEDILQQPFSDEKGSYLQLLMQTGLPFHVDHAKSDRKMDFQLRDNGVETVIGLPVESNPTARGALVLARCRPEAFLDSDVNLLMAMAYRIGRTLLEAQRSAQFEKIVQSGREISRHLDLAAVSTKVARMLPVIVHADASALILRNADGKLYGAAQTELNSSCTTALCTLAEHLIPSPLLREGEPYNSADIRETLAQLSLQSLNILPVQALLAIPIHRKNLINGILFALRFSAIAFNSSTSQIAMIYAELISSVLENSSLYQAVHNELAERKRLEEERRQWERQQQQLQKAESLNRMAGAIAHNFNNMLHAVTGNLELALMDSPPDSLLQKINQAMKASRRAAEVSGLMLTYLGQSLAEFELLDLSGLCRNNLSPLRNELRKDIILIADLPVSGPVVKANASQIQQVLKNLITNASESIGDNQGTIHLTVRTICLAEIPTTHRSPLDWRSPDNIFACMEVQDSGSGISDQEIEQIFDPFFSTKFTGRGLGLPVVLGIVRAHHGVITVESTQGKGSVFKVFFPLSTESLPQQPCKAAETLKIEGGITVLLVDDEEIVRNMAATMLKRIGFKVIEAKDGVEAIDVFRRNQGSISVVLCDLTMPRMDGWETSAALRELQPDVPIILSSGYDEAQVMQGNLSKRPQAFLHKPYQFSDLKAALTLALSR